MEISSQSQYNCDSPKIRCNLILHLNLQTFEMVASIQPIKSGNNEIPVL